MSDFKIRADALEITPDDDNKNSGLWGWVVARAKGVSTFLTGLRNLLVTLAFFLALSGAALIVYDLVTRDETALEPLSVPEAFAKRGLSGEVSARRLEDMIAGHLAAVDWERLPDKVDSAFKTPDFVEPATGVSLSTLIGLVRDYLDIEVTSVSGVIVCPNAACNSGEGQIHLRIRKGDALIRVRKVAFDVTNPDAGFSQAAAKLLEHLMPYHAAVRQLQAQPEIARSLAVQMIRDQHPRPSWGYVILGLVAFDQAGFETRPSSQNHLRQQALGHFEKANTLFLEKEGVEMVTALHNQGRLLTMQGEMDAALDRLNKAIELRPRSVRAHVSMTEHYYHRTRGAEPDSEDKDVFLKEAAKWADSGLALDPYHDVLRLRRAQFHIDLKEYQKAAQYLTQLYLEKGLVQELRWIYVDTLAKAGNKDRALFLAREYERSSEDVSAHSTYARVMLEHGTPEEAVEGSRVVYQLAKGRDLKGLDRYQAQWAEALLRDISTNPNKVQCETWLEKYDEYTGATGDANNRWLGLRFATCNMVLSRN